MLLVAEVESRMSTHDGIPPPPPAGGWSRDTRKQFEGNTMAVRLTVGPELLLLNLHFFNICRHHPTLKFKPHATDEERYVSGIDGVPLIQLKSTKNNRKILKIA